MPRVAWVYAELEIPQAGTKKRALFFYINFENRTGTASKHTVFFILSLQRLRLHCNLQRENANLKLSAGHL